MATSKKSPVKTKQSGAKKQRKARTGTKMEKCIAIVTDNPKLVRKAVIAKFIADAKLTKAGASTYYSLVMKKLK